MKLNIRDAVVSCSCNKLLLIIFTVLINFFEKFYHEIKVLTQFSHSSPWQQLIIGK